MSHLKSTFFVMKMIIICIWMRDVQNTVDSTHFMQSVCLNRHDAYRFTSFQPTTYRKCNLHITPTECIRIMIGWVWQNEWHKNKFRHSYAQCTMHNAHCALWLSVLSSQIESNNNRTWYRAGCIQRTIPTAWTFRSSHSRQDGCACAH